MPVATLRWRVRSALAHEAVQRVVGRAEREGRGNAALQQLQMCPTCGHLNDKKLADAMSSYWVNFAATGNPNGKGLPEWPAYNQKKGAQNMCSATP